jgi:oligoendopeptidase F
MHYTADLKKPLRQFLPEGFALTDWNSLEPWFKDLEQRVLDSPEALEKWLRDMSELEAVVSEDACWRQIRMTCDTENKQLEDAFTYFCMEIQPKIQPYADLLNRKLVESPYTTTLDQHQYFTYLRSVRKRIELFRDENIPLQAELSVLAQQFGVISGKMTVTMHGQEYTLQQAAKFLENPDRATREEAYRKIQDCRIRMRSMISSPN